jgi:hypothetical protein
LRLADADVAAVELLAVHRLDRSLGCRRLGERHEAEASRASGVAIGDDLRFHHFTETGEGVAEAFVVRVPAQSANEYLCRHLVLLVARAPHENVASGRRRPLLGQSKRNTA